MKKLILIVVLAVLILSLSSCLSLLGGLLDSETAARSEKTSEIKREADPPATSSAVTENGIIRQSVKEAIDSYEAFVDEYCEFMESYDPLDITKLLSYTDLIQKEAEMAKSFEALESDLNDAELVYYTEVSLRCSQKMLKASASIFG